MSFSPCGASPKPPYERYSQGECAKHIEAVWRQLGQERQQRAGLFLRDVTYRLHAEMTLQPNAPPGEKLVKYREMFERRAGRGQCVNQPYLGCRSARGKSAAPDRPD